jgi:excisionase family DNA binding protein
MSIKGGIMEKKKIYYTTGEVARLCGVGSATIIKDIRENRLKASTTPGRHYRILVENAEAYMESRKNRKRKPRKKQKRYVVGDPEAGYIKDVSLNRVRGGGGEVTILWTEMTNDAINFRSLSAAQAVYQLAVASCGDDDLSAVKVTKTEF